MTSVRLQAPIVVVGASAGGVDALKQLVRGLPLDFPAATVIVLHLASGAPSVLAQILDRECGLPVVTARDGDRLEGGVVSIGPPDRHVELADGVLRLTDGPPENRHRPSIDHLFASCAPLGARVVGVVLSGALDDGAEGLATIRASGGSAVVQDPASAEFPAMPSSALLAVPDALVLPLDQLAAGLVSLCGGTADSSPG